eukprot:303846_1
MMFGRKVNDRGMLVINLEPEPRPWWTFPCVPTDVAAWIWMLLISMLFLLVGSGGYYIHNRDTLRTKTIQMIRFKVNDLQFDNYEKESVQALINKGPTKKHYKGKIRITLFTWPWMSTVIDIGDRTGRVGIDYNSPSKPALINIKSGNTLELPPLFKVIPGNLNRLTIEMSRVDGENCHHEALEKLIKRWKGCTIGLYDSSQRINDKKPQELWTGFLEKSSTVDKLSFVRL